MGTDDYQQQFGFHGEMKVMVIGTAMMYPDL